MSILFYIRNLIIKNAPPAKSAKTIITIKIVSNILCFFKSSPIFIKSSKSLLENSIVEV